MAPKNEPHERLSCPDHERRIEALEHSIYGNGSAGIKEDVIVMKEQLITMNNTIREKLDQTKTLTTAIMVESIALVFGIILFFVTK